MADDGFVLEENEASAKNNTPIIALGLPIPAFDKLNKLASASNYTVRQLAKTIVLETMKEMKKMEDKK